MYEELKLFLDLPETDFIEEHIDKLAYKIADILIDRLKELTNILK